MGPSEGSINSLRPCVRQDRRSVHVQLIAELALVDSGRPLQDLEHCVLTARDLGRNLALPYRQVPLSRTADKAASESGNPVRAIDFG